MNDQGRQAGEFAENEAAREFLQLLMEYSFNKGRDYSMLLGQMDSMEYQLNRALEELHAIRGQLVKMQENPAKHVVLHMTDATEGRLHTAKESLAGMKVRIVEGAKEAVEGFKRTGVRALDKAVSMLGIKKALESVQKDIGESIADVKKSIEKVEDMGHELRSAGGHIKNAGRTMAGKERQEVDGGSEGRFQAAILSPLRMEKNILNKINNMALAAIGNVERLEEAAERAKEKAIPKTKKEERETGEKTNERTEEETEKKTERKTEEEPEGKTGEKANGRTEEKIEKKPERKAEEKPEGKRGEKTNERADEKTERKTEEKPERETKAKTNGRAEAKIEKKPETKTGEKPEGKTEKKSNVRINGQKLIQFPTNKREEKPSVLKNLKETRAQAAARPSQTPDRGTKSHGATL